MNTETNTTQGAQYEGADRYPLLNDRVYKACLEAVIGKVKAHLLAAEANANSRGTRLKSSPLTQLEKAGNLTADFCLRHFAGIFDHKSELSSGQRRLVQAILTDAAGMMAERVQSARQELEKKAAAEVEPTKAPQE